MEQELRQIGLHGFREGQREVLERLLLGGPVLAVMPTGWGKSILFVAPVKLWRWRVLVISPLIALIEDQIASARKFSLRATGCYAGREPGSDWDICFVTVERYQLWQRLGSEILRNIDLIVFDEVHCLLEWGFRPAMRKTLESLRELQGRRILFLSATLSLQQEQELQGYLANVEQAYTYRLPRIRKNIYLSVREIESQENRYALLLEELKDVLEDCCALIYTSTRADCEAIASFLDACGLASVYFHAGLPLGWRQQRVQDFLAGRLRIVVCTSAFGLGINFPRISHVIHWGLPYTLSQYWQEVGRAGRGIRFAKATLLWSLSDWLLQRNKAELRAEVLSHWQYWAHLGCRRRDLRRFYPSIGNMACGNCDYCINAVGRRAWWAHHPDLLVQFLEKMNTNVAPSLEGALEKPLDS